MKNITITTVNTKGQLVIPKEMRDTLGITGKVPLEVSLKGDGIMIYPIERVVRKVDGKDSFDRILEITQGAWGPEAKGERKKEKERRAKELAAWKERRKLW